MCDHMGSEGGRTGAVPSLFECDQNEHPQRDMDDLLGCLHSPPMSPLVDYTLRPYEHHADFLNMGEQTCSKDVSRLCHDLDMITTIQTPVPGPPAHIISNALLTKARHESCSTYDHGTTLGPHLQATPPGRAHTSLLHTSSMLFGDDGPASQSLSGTSQRGDASLLAGGSRPGFSPAVPHTQPSAALRSLPFCLPPAALQACPPSLSSPPSCSLYRRQRPLFRCPSSGQVISLAGDVAPATEVGLKRHVRADYLLPDSPHHALARPLQRSLYTGAVHHSMPDLSAPSMHSSQGSFGPAMRSLSEEHTLTAPPPIAMPTSRTLHAALQSATFQASSPVPAATCPLSSSPPSQLLHALGSVASGSTSSDAAAAAAVSSSSSPVQPAGRAAKAGPKAKRSASKGVKKKAPGGSAPNTQGLTCTECGTQSTPLWRAGPLGPKTLCNACGVRRMKMLNKKHG